MALLVCLTVFMKWMLGGLTSAAPTVPRTKASTPRRRMSGQLSRTPRGALQQSATAPSHPPAYIPPYDGAMQFGAVAFQPVLLDFSSANTSRVGSGSMRQPHHMRIGRSRSLSVVRRPYYDGDDQMAYATRDAMHGDCTQDTSDIDEDGEGAEDEMGAE